MLKIQRKFFLKILFLVLFSANSVFALDIIKITNSESTANDKRSLHKKEVIKRALEITISEYGPYELRTLNIIMNRHRALPIIIQGKISNIYISAASEEWDNKTIPIKIPIRGGLLNYRLLLINKNDKNAFAQVQSLKDLKTLKAGLRAGWVTADVFKKNDIPYVETQNFDGLFFLLDMHRFNYIPRAIYEIFDELYARQNLLPNVIIEPTLAIHLPMPTYVYVSPAEPRLAKRLEKGLRIMLENGELHQILRKYYADDLERVNLKNRTIIKIHNPYFKDQHLLSDKSLWYPF